MKLFEVRCYVLIELEDVFLGLNILVGKEQE
jgi:hypothetical protein